MSIKNYSFEEMEASALNIVDEESENISPNDEVSSIYKLDDELLKEGWDYDSTGIYIHYNETYQAIGIADEKYDNFMNKHARDNIYLWIGRDFDTQKKMELKFQWMIKTSKGYDKKRDFSFANQTLNIGEEKILKELNKKVSFSGGKSGNPASEGSYVTFVDDFTDKIADSPYLEVFKEVDFDSPEDMDDETFEENSDIINSFSEYPEDIQKEAIKIINKGVLFEEIQKSVSLTHQGDNTSRDTLILMGSSLFFDGSENGLNSVHGLIGGDSGKGKSDLANAVLLNFPNKYVKNLRNVSPKYPFYDDKHFNEDYNILFFDDSKLNDDTIELLKLFSDNTTREKVLRTVKNQNPLVKSFGDAKFVVILTYAKTIPDGELANRLFNLGVIVDDENPDVSNKIRDNNQSGGNFNPIHERNRLIIQASIHYLIEQDINVFNPFLSIFKPQDYINRDVNHVSNMIKAKTFFESSQRRQIQINNGLIITMGAFEDFKFIIDIWSEDVDAQRYKLSERQKQILKILPEMTNEEAYQHIDDLAEKLNTIDSRKAKAKLLDEEYTKKNMAKLLKCNQSTLVNDLDRNNQGTSKSLYEMGLIDKIQIEDGVYNSPNIYYKIKVEDNALKSDKSIVYNMYSQFTHLISYSITKQKIIIDLLYYVKIIINERGYTYLKNYCNNYDKNIDVNSYDSLFEFINSFFDGFNYDKYSVNIDNASLDVITKMSMYKHEIDKLFNEKNNEDIHPKSSKILHSKKTKENDSLPNMDDDSICKSNLHNIHNNESNNKAILDKINVDYDIAYEICNVLLDDDKTLDEIRSDICQGVNPDDYNMENLPLKVEMTIKRLVENDYLLTIEPINQAKQYKASDKLIKLFNGDDK